jgi:hypothetical protein
MSAPVVPDPALAADRAHPNQWRRWSRRPRGWTQRRSDGVRSGWHAYRPMVGAAVPDWAIELALTIERPLDRSLDGFSQPRALLLARAADRWRLLVQALGDAMRGVDRMAGTSPPLPSVRLVPPHQEAGFEAVPRSEVIAQLRLASERGHTTGHHRTRALRAGVTVWEPGAGIVLTCRGQVAVSLQAVIALRGLGDPMSLRPPPGGATVFRAWRCPRRRTSARRGVEEPEADWALITGVVVASTAASGLARAARRQAAQAETAGWKATVVTGAAALALARAGDPRHPPPASGAVPASRDAVLAMLTSCLAASANQIGRPALPRPWLHQQPRH